MLIQNDNNDDINNDNSRNNINNNNNVFRNIKNSYKRNVIKINYTFIAKF